MTKKGDRAWWLWPIVPIYPYGHRRTLRREIIPGKVWLFEQVQGIFYVVVPIRMTVIKMAQGGLMAFSAVAPTRECVRLLRELEAEHGPVRYIIMPTVTGVEHKYFTGPFARKFKQADVYAAPNQWSFPLDLPLSWLGFPPKRTHILPYDASQTPFYDEFDYQIVGPIELNLKPYTEVAVFHRETRSLLTIDAVLSIPNTPPPVVEQNPHPLLFHARDSATEPIQDTPENRLKGWRRIALFTFYFQPSTLDVPKLGRAIKEASKSPNKSKKNYFGLYPFDWEKDWPKSFETLRKDGRLIVAPILQTLIFNRGSEQVLEWVEKVAQWNFEQVFPCHFTAPVAAGPEEFSQAFEFLRQPNPRSWSGFDHEVPMSDLETLGQIERTLNGSFLADPEIPTKTQ